MEPLILLSNDDGIEAPGLEALARACSGLGEIWTVAPDGERSAASHCLTLRRDVPVRQLGARSFAVDGWPADAVYIALFGLLPRRPALVLSGVNRGPNLGTDVVYSGTVGAAREAFVRGVPAVAVSLVEGEDYALAASFSAELARALLSSGAAALLNVNVPGRAALGAKVATLGRRIYPERAVLTGRRDGLAYYRIGGGGELRDAMAPGTDGEAVGRGLISVTPLGLHAVEPALDGPAEAWSSSAWAALDALRDEQESTR